MNDNGLQKVETMLDFGAGMCGAPAIFQQQGFCHEITIFDKAFQAEEIAKILGIQHIKNIEYERKKKFDLIYSSHSLEHVQDVGQTLSRFSMMVKKGGHVFIEVPNIANKTVLEMSHHAPHTYNFSQKSLCKAMLLYGFETIACDTYGIMISDRIKKKHSELNVPDSIISLFRKIS
jgi:2-polyprenyl-3-methyl-5-hydroxy-6-metoxy-1,4-benzoquinol methylase